MLIYAISQVYASLWKATSAGKFYRITSAYFHWLDLHGHYECMNWGDKT